MELIELYYKAFRAFRKYTEENYASKKLRKKIRRSSASQDSIASIKYNCTIQSDWVENIEEGLIYVEKAIREERQFIRTEGEVIPIEKVKRVSKASVEHLAKHSNLITRVPKDKKADLIPEKLYMVEKLTDYQVYENRFLYLLLCYLKDFIQLRLDNIKDKTTTFETEINMNKNLDENQRHLQYDLDYKDVYKNDQLLIEQYKKIPLVDRVENIFALVVSLLAHPLMKEVSKAPLIKPPVIKTNILRMNPNFRAAVTLYDYVTAYNKDGYIIEEIKKNLSPFPKKVGDEIVETIQSTSNIAYILGNNLESQLENCIIKQEKLDKEKLDKNIKDEINHLKKRMKEMDEDPSEYILKLEKRNTDLEKTTMQLSREEQKNETLTQKVKSLESDQKDLKNKLLNVEELSDKKDTRLSKMKQKYFDDMTEAENLHKKEIKLLNESHQFTIESLNTHHEALIEDLNRGNAIKEKELIETHNNIQTTLKQQHEEALYSLIQEKKRLENDITKHLQRIETIKLEREEVIKTYELAIQDLHNSIERLNEEKKYSEAQYKALKKQQGLSIEEDYSSKQQFKQLEQEMTAYKKLFKEQWKKAKGQIRQKVKDETFPDNHDINQD